jgi:hypothetical protein
MVHFVQSKKAACPGQALRGTGIVGRPARQRGTTAAPDAERPQSGLMREVA